MNLKRVIAIVLILIWMIIVFEFSSENAEESSERSYKITQKTVEMFNKDINEAQKDNKTNFWHNYVRKFAHFSLYTVGGILFYLFFNTYNINIKNKILFSILAGLIYATGDEIHQLIISGRSGQITDVLLDVSGVILGTIIMNVVLKSKIMKKLYAKIV